MLNTQVRSHCAVMATLLSCTSQMNRLFCASIILFSASFILCTQFEYLESCDSQLRRPDEVVFELSEDEFEDYLDEWLYMTQQAKQSYDTENKAGCEVSINSLKEPLPIYALNGKLLTANGNSGKLSFDVGSIVTATCMGSGNGLTHPSTTVKPSQGKLICQSGSSFTSPGWLSGSANFEDILCSVNSPRTQKPLGTDCLGGGTLVSIYLDANGEQYSLIESCFHKSNAAVLYVTYQQNPEHVVSQPHVERPDFSPGTFFPGLKVDTLYGLESQKASLDYILGPGSADRYLNKTYFLARGHLSAKTDFVFAPEQRGTFVFINVAPQWQTFNGGNWNTLEQSLRQRIADAGYRTTIYTGTWGTLTLPSISGTPKEIYLSSETKQIPVPLWFFKVVHDTVSKKSIVFLGLNNPHVSLDEAKKLAFCKDICDNNSDYSWLKWNPSKTELGYSLCCELEDFKNTVNFLPTFPSNGNLS